MWRLVNNTEFDLRGVYYGGLNEKYHDMFNITIRDCAKLYVDIESAKADADMLKRRFKYDEWKIEEV